MTLTEVSVFLRELAARAEVDVQGVSVDCAVIGMKVRVDFECGGERAVIEEVYSYAELDRVSRPEILLERLFGRLTEEEAA